MPIGINHLAVLVERCRTEYDVEAAVTAIVMMDFRAGDLVSYLTPDAERQRRTSALIEGAA